LARRQKETAERICASLRRPIVLKSTLAAGRLGIAGEAGRCSRRAGSCILSRVFLYFEARRINEA
jgi:hypothetical protein